MSANKTIATDASVRGFLQQVEPSKRRTDAHQLLDLFSEATGEPPVLWGSSIIGFGDYHYRYESGREGDMMKTGFAPRKAHLVLYIMSGFESSSALREKLGKHRVGKSCLYVNKLDDVDLEALKRLIQQDYAAMSARYHAS